MNSQIERELNELEESARRIAQLREQQRQVDEQFKQKAAELLQLMQRQYDLMNGKF